MYDTLIEVAQLKALIATGDVVVVDCGFDLGDAQAGRRAYLAAHVPSARYLHLDEDLSGPPTGSNGRHPLPDPAVLADKLRGIGLHRDQQLVAYDDAGGCYAARLWWLMRWLGHRPAAVLDGGFSAWRASGGDIESGPATSVKPGDFVSCEADAEMVVDAGEILGALGSGELLVVDARSPERFRGDPNPLDPVAGHIPGARNRFFRDNLGPDGRFKSRAALAAEWRGLLDGGNPTRLVMQCGSGVTACHNALALALAGIPDGRLYPGSWSEWISDPARPVERGQ